MATAAVALITLLHCAVKPLLVSADDCGDPPEVENFAFNTHNGRNTRGTTVGYYCREGYWADGGFSKFFEVTCSYDPPHRWSAPKACISKSYVK